MTPTPMFKEFTDIFQKIIDNQNIDKYPTISDTKLMLNVLQSVAKIYEELNLMYVDKDNEPIFKDYIYHIKVGTRDFIELYDFGYDTSKLMIRSEIVNPILNAISRHISQYEFIAYNYETFECLKEQFDYLLLDESEEKRDFKYKIKNLLSRT